VPAPAGPAAGAAAALADALTLKGWKAGESGSGACARAAWRLAQCAHYMPAFVQPLHPTLRARLPVRIRGTVAGLPTAQASRLPHAAKPKVAVTYGSKLKRPAKVIAGDRTLAARAYLKVAEMSSGSGARKVPAAGVPRTAADEHDASCARSNLTSAARPTGGAAEPVSRPSCAGAKQWVQPHG